MIFMNSPEHKFFLGGILTLAAAIIFAGALYLHDSRTAPSGKTAAPAALPPGTPNPADSVPFQSKDAPTAPVGGIIEHISGDTFTMTSQQGLPGASTAATFTVTLDSKTELYTQGALKTAAQYATDMQAFLKAISYSTDSNVVYEAPDRYVHTPAVIADLKPGVFVMVTASSAMTQNKIQAQKVGIMPPASTN